VTEQGIADIRELSPKEQAIKIIENCAHPDFKHSLYDYFNKSIKSCEYKHTPQVFEKILI